MADLPQAPVSVVVIKRLDADNPAHTLIVCQSDSGKVVNAYKPDKGDDSHMPVVQVGDRIKVQVTGPAKREGEFKGKLLPRNEQLNAAQTEWRRREQGEHGRLIHIEAEVTEADHACLKYAHKLEKRLRPSLTLAEYTRELLLGSLHPVRALWLSQQETTNV
jgi:hypothetical protein